MRNSRPILLFCLSFVFLSCASGPLPKAQMPGGAPARKNWPDIEALSPAWLPYKSGIGFMEINIEKPRLKAWALRVDLENPRVAVVVTDTVMREGVVPAARVSSFALANDCAAAINANPFDRVSATEGEDRVVDGIAVSHGALIAGPRAGWGALVFYKDGKAAIVPQSELISTDGTENGGIENAVGGFHVLLKNGEIPPEIMNRLTVRHPRSAAGISGSVLYLMAVDGRRPGSIGATEAELALMLKNLGAEDGLNFDGGGSTALALKYPDSKIRTVNVPIHGGIPGRERAVAICLGIVVSGCGEKH